MSNVLAGQYGPTPNERALLVAHVAALAAAEIEFSVVDDRGGTNSMLVLVRRDAKLPFPKVDRYVDGALWGYAQGASFGTVGGES